ncbi:SNF2 family N-terminal domain-containing protein [Melanogaster broomeanus]|nr:SNF2 family N-terminal domain-containing protein [Melanogaster broomeanus]
MDLSTQRAAILAAAKAQLGLHPSVASSSVPDYYLQEIQSLLSINPDCGNFKVAFQPSQGYGFVTCLDTACPKPVTMLGPNHRIPDGGKQRGFGSLQNYMVRGSQNHVRTAPNGHSNQQRTVSVRRSVDSNLESNAMSARSTALDMKPYMGLLAQLDANFGNISGPSSVSRHAVDVKHVPLTARNDPSRLHVKPEPVESTVPRQRQSSSLVFLGVENDKTDTNPHTPLPSKGAGIGLAKSPLACIDANAASMTFHATPLVNYQAPARPAIQMQQTARVSERDAVKPELDAPQTTRRDPMSASSTLPTIRLYGDESDESDVDVPYDRFIGPVANQDDINKFLIAAGNSEFFDGNATVDKALEKLGLNGQYQLLPGMAVSLMPHQTIGVAWALDREKSSDKGGILGDEMGLGKTTNLILAPMALLGQWKLEIEMKTANGMSCLIYHGSNKPRSKKELMKYDIVLTTFQRLNKLAKEKQRKQKKVSFVVSDSDDDRRARKKKREIGLLFQVDWYRVIIDEAQNIRNRRTRISRSVTDLEATYRWCLTGTPIVNGLVDAYGLFRFIKFRPWYDWQEFNSHISRFEKKNPSLASARLQAVFKSILLRRKKDSLLDGQKLIELPTKHVDLERLAFSLEERDIYQMVEARSQARFNRFLRAGTVLKNYHHARLVSTNFVMKLRAKYKEAALMHMRAERESADASVEGEECPVCMDAFTDAIVTACGHAFCRECVVNVLNGPFVQDPEDNQKYKGNEKPCPSCRLPISAEKIFVRQAFEPTDDELTESSPSRQGSGDDSDIEMLDVSELARRNHKGKGRATKRLRKKRDVMDSEGDDHYDDEDDMSDFIVDDDEDEGEKDARREFKRRLQKKRKMIIDSDDDIKEDETGGYFWPSNEDNVEISTFDEDEDDADTYMKKMMEHLLTWAEENPGEKTIVVSQWTEALKLVSNYLSENQIGHVKFQGSMNRVERDKAVRVFMVSDKAPVMLMSLKCGGVGLNLTRANRVISLDLGWSEAIESQAFDRVHRLGQQKETFVRRLVIENTVEDRVLALQERKKDLADGSLGEGTGKKIGRLSVRELANLSELLTRGTVFGLDHHGNVL